MNRAEKYDPEDIEYLLSHKSFEELYPEEKEFVLRHMDSEAEYHQMRTMILQLTDSPSIDDEWSAPMSMREELIVQHEKKHEKKTLFIWLNSLFVMTGSNLSWYKRPGPQLAFASCLILIIGLVFFNPTSLTENALSLKPEAKLIPHTEDGYRSKEKEQNNEPRQDFKQEETRPQEDLRISHNYTEEEEEEEIEPIAENKASDYEILEKQEVLDIADEKDLSAKGDTYFSRGFVALDEVTYYQGIEADQHTLYQANEANEAQRGIVSTYDKKIVSEEGRKLPPNALNFDGNGEKNLELKERSSNSIAGMNGYFKTEMNSRPQSSLVNTSPNEDMIDILYTCW